MHVAEIGDRVADLMEAFDADRRDELISIVARMLDRGAVEVRSKALREESEEAVEEVDLSVCKGNR